MKVFHLTHPDNVPSILTGGLRADRSEGRRKVVWLVEASQLGWAIGHVGTHKGIDGGRLHLFKLDMNWRHLRKSGRKGVWVCPGDVPAGMLSYKGSVSGCLLQAEALK